MRFFSHPAGRVESGAIPRGAVFLWLLLVLCVSGVAAAEDPVAVRGVVVDQRGSPVANAIVTSGFARASTGPDGRFSITLPSGRADLRVSHPDYLALRHELEVTDAAIDLELVLAPPMSVSESITVTTIRAGEEVPVTKRNIDAEELEKLSYGQDVPTLLQYTPSMTWYSDSGAGSNYSYFSLRGIQQTRINMTFDGAPLNDPAEHALYFNNFHDFTSAVDSIQIQRGVGTSTVGTAAFGGSINFASIPFAPESTTEVRLGLGSWDSLNSSVAWQSGTFDNGLSLYGRVSYADTDGYRDNSGSEYRTLFFNAGWQGESSQWKFVSFSGDERSNLSFYAVAPATLDENRRFNPLLPDEREHFGQDFAQFQYSRAFGEDTLLTASLYYNGADGWFRLWDDPVAQNDLLQFGIDQHFVGSMVTLSRTSGNLETSAGLHYNDFRGDHTLDIAGERIYLNTGYKETANAFVKAGWSSGPWYVYGDAQLRWAEFRYEGSIDLGSVDWSFFDPKLGVRYAVSPRTSFYASAGKAEREPTRLDLLSGEDDATVVHDLDAVEPEKVLDFEAGVDFASPRFVVHANLYAMEFRDEIALTGELSEIGLPLRENVDRSYRRGVEIDARWRIGRHWTLTHSSNLSRNRIREWTQYYDIYDSMGNWIGSEPRVHRDIPPILTPEAIVNQGVEWSDGTTTIGVTGRWVGNAHLDNTGNDQFRTPSYATLDLRAAVSLGRWWSTGNPKFSIHANNVLDESEAYPGGYSYQYIERDDAGRDTISGLPYYYPLAERNVTATLELRF